MRQVATVIVLGVLCLVACDGCGSKPPKHDWAQLRKDRSENVFTSPIALIQVRKPETWRFVASEEIRTARESIRIADSEVAAKIATTHLPIISVMKYEASHVGVNPTVQVGVRPHKGKTAYGTLRTALLAMRQRPPFKEFRVIGEVERRRVDDAEAAYAVFSFSLETHDGLSESATSRLCYITSLENLIIVGMTGPSEGPDRSEQEFSEILSSLKIGQ